MSTHTKNIDDREIVEIEVDTEDGVIEKKLVGDEIILDEMRQREIRAVQGNSEVITHRGQQRDAQRAARQAHENQQRVLAGGGGQIKTALVGTVGEEIAEVLHFAETARQAKALMHRIEDEVVEIKREQEERARLAKLDEQLEAAWTASASKAKVPDIIAPTMRWEFHERPQGRAETFASEAHHRINAQHAQRNQRRVVDVLDKLDEIILATANEILTAAGSAHEALTRGGLTVDSHAQEIVDVVAENGQADLLVAHKAWREAVGLWTDLQSTRRWIVCAIVAGFDPKRPENVITSTAIEASAWRGQFAEVGVLTAAGAHEALKWWINNGRPAAVGVSIESKEQGA